MLTFLLTIDNVIHDVSQYIIPSSVAPTYVLHQDLNPCTSKLAFALSKECPAIDDLKGTSSYVEIEVTDGASPFFKGYLTDNYEWGLSSYGSSSINLYAEDPGIKKLKVQWTSANNVYTKWNSLALCNPSDPTNSVLHKIATLSGITIDSGVPVITKSVSVLVKDSDAKSYWDVLSKILFDFGYVFYFKKDGKLALYNLARTSTSPIATITPYNGIVGSTASDQGLRIAKRLSQYKEADVIWSSRKTVNNITVFNDITNQTSAHTCEIELAAGAYYPEGSTATNYVMSDYAASDSGTIIDVVSATPSFLYDTGITYEFENMGKQAKIRFHNPTGVAKKIYQIKVIGNEVVEKSAQTTTTSGYGTPFYTYESTYIYNEADAQSLANTIRQYYEYGDYTYQVKSDRAFNPGDIISISDTTWEGDTSKVVVLSRSDRYNDVGDVAYYVYNCTGIDDFAIQATTSRSVSSTPGSGVSPDTIVTKSNLGDPYTDLTFGGVSASVIQALAGGGTTSPVSPTITATAFLNAIQLVWSRQQAVAGLTSYDIQVSLDGTTWYCPKLDRTDWKDESSTNPWKVITPEMFVHTLPPNQDINGDAQVWTLQYQVRCRLSNGTTGPWGAITASSSLLSTGDVAENSITANKLEVGVLNAMIANINDSISIDPNNGLMASTATPDLGNQRTIMSENTIKMQYGDGAQWIDKLSISANDKSPNYTMVVNDMFEVSPSDVKIYSNTWGLGSQSTAFTSNSNTAIYTYTSVDEKSVWAIYASYAPVQTVNATTMEAGKVYYIFTLGTTDYTAFGAPSNTVGISFRATGPATGTGTVKFYVGSISARKWDGATWGAETVLKTFNQITLSMPIPAQYGNNVYLMYYDYAADGNGRRLINNLPWFHFNLVTGAASADQLTTSNPCYGASTNGFVYNTNMVAFADGWAMMFRYSTDGGSTWQTKYLRYTSGTGAYSVETISGLTGSGAISFLMDVTIDGYVVAYFYNGTNGYELRRSPAGVWSISSAIINTEVYWLKAFSDGTILAIDKNNYEWTKSSSTANWIQGSTFTSVASSPTGMANGGVYGNYYIIKARYYIYVKDLMKKTWTSISHPTDPAYNIAIFKQGFIYSFVQTNGANPTTTYYQYSINTRTGRSLSDIGVARYS